jgi:hypothetical protein
MSYVPGYDFDFFISYASVDNDPVPSSKLGWVDTLVGILTSGSGLAGKLGRREAFNYWLDKQQLRGNHEADNHIPEQVRRSAVLVVVLSPGYLASTFCRLELDTFLQSIGGASERLFVVSRERIEDVAGLPEALRRPRKYDFWRLDTNNKSRTLGWPQPMHDNPEDRPYFLMVEDLCKDLADKLKELRREGESARQAQAALMTVPATPAPASGKPAVLLAETTDDLIRKRDEARRYLEQAGVDVLPAGTYYGLAAAGYENAVLADLTRSAAFVQLLGPELGRALADVPDGFGWLQYNLAKRAQRTILQWRSPDLGDLSIVDDERQRRLMEAAEAMPFEDFKQKIVRAVTAPPPKQQGGRPSFFFINCAAVDTGEADDIGSQLGSDVDWERPAYEDKPKAKVLQDKIETNLVDCDGLLIVHGKARSAWVKDQLQQYRKVRARRAQDPRVLAVVQAGPEREELKGIGLAGLKIIGVNDLPGVVKSALTS